MHGKYHKRVPAERDALKILRIRAADEHGLNDNETEFSGPITITIIQTIPVSTVASSTEWVTTTAYSTMPETTASSLTTSATLESTSSTTSTSFTTSTTSTVSTSSASSTTTPLTSSLPPVSSPKPTATNGTDTQQQGSLSSSSQSLSSGGIAGIVIAILAVLALVAALLLRRRVIQKRKRSTNAWARRSPVGPFSGRTQPKPFTFTSASEKDARESLTAGDDGLSLPPMAFNAPTAASHSTVVSTAVSPVYTTNPSVLSPFTATVVCTFITTLPDELAISIGEKIRVLAEYDDGWALGMNASGEQGMVPLECLDRGAAPASLGLQTQTDTRNSRRVSSLDVNALGTLAYRR